MNRLLLRLLSYWFVLAAVGAAFAQTPNPVTPGYQVCSNASGTTKCSFQPVGTDNVLGSAGLPTAALAVATCGAQSLTAGVVYVMTMDLAGTLCTGSGGGGGGTAVTIADGADVAEGAITDAAATTGGTGTVSAKLRLMTSQLATIIGNQASTGVQGAVNVTLSDCSGTITTGGAAQNAFAANAGRHGFTIANIDTTEVLWVSFTTTAVASGTGSYPLGPADATTFGSLSSFTSPLGMGINTALSVVGATTAHKFTCTVW